MKVVGKKAVGKTPARRATATTKAKQKARKQAEKPIRVEPEQQVLPVQEVEQPSLAPYDEMLLDICRTRWQFGDWPRLASVSFEAVQQHPDRAKIVLLIAAAHFQIGQAQQAHRLMQVALDWGASRRQAVQMLLSGIHDSLAEGNALLGNTDAAHAHYLQALRAGGVPGDVELLAQARAARLKSITKT